jgi:serine/threonine-protein kinase
MVDMILTTGRVLDGRYQVDELVGSGGMASVWRGRDLRLDRPVAIKELAGAWLRDPTALARFDREARTAAKLGHPNIVAVHDVGIDGDSRYLVMELIEGTTVAELLDAGPLPIDQVVGIAVQACDALAAAHAAGVIHRDIKPANLIVTPNGIVKVCDFGIARALSELAELNLTDQSIAMGSSRYIAPEQIAGATVDHRADLYSLGCTMYAMLTGTAPFTGDTPMQVLDRHVNEAPVPVLRRRGDTPPALAALVGRLLAKRPADRPVSANEVKGRLIALDDEPTVAHVVTRRPARRRRRRFLAVASLVLAAATAGTVYLLQPLSLPGSQPATGAPDRPPAAVTTAPVAEPTATPSATLTPSAVPSATPAPSTAPPTPSVRPPATGPAPTPPAPLPPPQGDPVTNIRGAIAALSASGDLQRTGAKDLGGKVDDYELAMGEPNLDQAIKAIGEMRQMVANLRRENRLSAAGQQRLNRDVNLIDDVTPDPIY